MLRIIQSHGCSKNYVLFDFYTHCSFFQNHEMIIQIIVTFIFFYTKNMFVLFEPRLPMSDTWMIVP